MDGDVNQLTQTLGLAYGFISRALSLGKPLQNDV